MSIGGDASERLGPECDQERIDRAVCLLSQQIWCWGRDILRPEGNWLLNLGFSRVRPPAERENCSSLYTLNLPGGRCVVLRAFGVFYGARQLGGVYVARYKFQPRYTNCATLKSPPWKAEDLPKLRRPTSMQRNSCVSLTLELIDWIRDYEVNIADCLGLEYRRSTLTEWDDGTRPVVPAEEVASAWRELSLQVAANPEAYLLGKVHE